MAAAGQKAPILVGALPLSLNRHKYAIVYTDMLFAASGDDYHLQVWNPLEMLTATDFM